MSAGEPEEAYEAVLATAEILCGYSALLVAALAHGEGIELSAVRVIREKLAGGRTGPGFGEWVAVLEEIVSGRKWTALLSYVSFRGHSILSHDLVPRLVSLPASRSVKNCWGIRLQLVIELSTDRSSRPRATMPALHRCRSRRIAEPAPTTWGSGRCGCPSPRSRTGSIVQRSLPSPRSRIAVRRSGRAVTATGHPPPDSSPVHRKAVGSAQHSPGSPRAHHPDQPVALWP